MAVRAMNAAASLRPPMAAWAGGYPSWVDDATRDSRCGGTSSRGLRGNRFTASRKLAASHIEHEPGMVDLVKRIEHRLGLS